jgi:hypothetical protein
VCSRLKPLKPHVCCVWPLSPHSATSRDPIPRATQCGFGRGLTSIAVQVGPITLTVSLNGMMRSNFGTLHPYTSLSVFCTWVPQACLATCTRPIRPLVLLPPHPEGLYLSALALVGSRSHTPPPPPNRTSAPPASHPPPPPRAAVAPFVVVRPGPDSPWATRWEIVTESGVVIHVTEVFDPSRPATTAQLLWSISVDERCEHVPARSWFSFFFT